MKNFFDKNRNDLSRYFYDLSKAILMALIAIPFFQEKFGWKFSLVGFSSTVIFPAMGMILKKG